MYRCSHAPRGLYSASCDLNTSSSRLGARNNKTYRYIDFELLLRQAPPSVGVTGPQGGARGGPGCMAVQRMGVKRAGLRPAKRVGRPVNTRRVGVRTAHARRHLRVCSAVVCIVVQFVWLYALLFFSVQLFECGVVVYAILPRSSAFFGFPPITLTAQPNLYSSKNLLEVARDCTVLRIFEFNYRQVVQHSLGVEQGPCTGVV